MNNDADQHVDVPSDQDQVERAAMRPVVMLHGMESLQRLRDRIINTLQELERLRTSNAELAERIRELEERPHVDLDGTVLAFDEDPQQLREKVEGFIRAIDTYIAKDTG